MGVPVDGYYLRDLLQVSSLLDEFVGFGKTVHITACQVPSGTSPDAWDAWLRRLTVRTCYRLAKKDRRRTQVEVGVIPTKENVRTPDASADVADREWVMSELGRLDIDQRSVIALHYYLDLPMREVAEILDIPFGTAASRLHRGLENLRLAMREHPAADYPLATERSS